MPPPRLPPTPAASLDITGKTTTSHAPSISLGPAAREDRSERSFSASPSVNGSDSSYHPASPVSPNTTRRKPSTSSKAPAKSGDDFALPPPPSRPRKIIQMKPGPSETLPDAAGDADRQLPAAKGGKKRGAGSATTAAGRKVARKTAHSLIERRRRSKMNEEFGVLKDMIPACKGQEMHKLAILQASIEYLRYLEKCIGDLQTNNQAESIASPEGDHDMVMNEDDQDESMREVEHQSSPANTAFANAPTQTSSLAPAPSPVPAYSPHTLPSLSSITTTSSRGATSTSPSYSPLDPTPRPRQYSLTSSSVAPSPYMLPLSSTSASPAFNPQQHKSSLATVAGEAMQRFTLTSPALEPQENKSDREAMAALLMLNSDRRPGPAWTPATTSHPHGSNGARTRGSRQSGAMSVKDLLGP
ncbi:hypothetical protein ANO11243_057870 [Dothideomycetidae sp. 11243]|nr:hypothetical protein ANO11243_057870 [fungal sp. No.11243]